MNQQTILTSPVTPAEKCHVTTETKEEDEKKEEPSPHTPYKEKEKEEEEKPTNHARARARISPTLEEVRQECETQGYDIDPEVFWAHYESDDNGWPRNWKAKLLKWFKLDYKHGRIQKPKPEPAPKPVIPDNANAYAKRILEEINDGLKKGTLK